MKMAFGADCIVRDTTGRILLVKREDFRIWTTPGGGMEHGEHPAQTAVRETVEESGVEAQADTLIGAYTWGDPRRLLFVYSGHPTGGTPHPTDESVASRYFAPDDLPSRLMPVKACSIEDALHDAQGVLRQDYRPPSMRLLFKTLVGLRRVRNRIQGRPETPVHLWDVALIGNLPANGTGPQRIIAAPDGEHLVWDTLAQQATRQLGHPVRVTRLTDIQVEGDLLALHFALSSDPAPDESPNSP